MSFFGVVRGFERKKATMPSRQREVFSSKMAPRGWYKGRGVKTVGTINTKGKFIVDKSKIPEIIVPDLTNFDVKTNQKI
jgi:large subunit ribosomal protein L41